MPSIRTNLSRWWSRSPERSSNFSNSNGSSNSPVAESGAADWSGKIKSFSLVAKFVASLVLSLRSGALLSHRTNRVLGVSGRCFQLCFIRFGSKATQDALMCDIESSILGQ